MQFKKYAVVGVLITLYLSTDSWCRSIPENKSATNLNLAGKKNAPPSHSDQIQICGKELTDFLLVFCKGVFNSLNEVNYSSAEAKITENCCTQTCKIEHFQSYCGGSQLFTPKETSEQNLHISAIRSQPSGLSAEERPLRKSKNKRISEVRVRQRKYGKRKWGKSKKRKTFFKRKCAYKSFGHYLLKLKWGNGVRDNLAKEPKKVNQAWRSIEIGTISPEMENFGGQPIVEVKRNRSKSI